MIEMTEKRLRMINRALCAYIAQLESDRKALAEDYTSFRQSAVRIDERTLLKDVGCDIVRHRFTALIDEYTSLKEDIETLLLRY